MNHNYSLHKRFVKDVDRIVRRNENLEKVISYTVNYLSLRQIYPEEISDQNLIEITRKVSFMDLEIPEIYRELVKELSNQEFIFRIKRVKYLKNTKDSVVIVSSPLLQKIGKELMSTTITSNVMVMESMDYTDNSVSVGKIVECDDSESESSENCENQNVDTLEYLIKIWDDSEERLTWLLKNMKLKSKKYGYSQDNGYTPEEISVATGKNVLTIKHYIRKYLRETYNNIS